MKLIAEYLEEIIKFVAILTKRGGMQTFMIRCLNVEQYFEFTPDYQLSKKQFGGGHHFFQSQDFT